MKRFLLISITSLFLLSPLLCSALDSLEIVKKGDEVLNAPKDAYIYNTMLIIDRDGNKSERSSEMFQKGTDKRLIRFLTPADQKGISFLTLPDDIMYLYLPAFKKVRQIASHVKNQNFAGTDFTYDDLSSFEFAITHIPELVREDQETYVIRLSPKDSRGKDYHYLHAYYRKDNFYPIRAEYYDSTDTLWKILERKNIEKIKGYWIATKLEVIDLKKNHSTFSNAVKIDFDTGLDDSFFTKRNLIRYQ